jgi:acyl carrier protein
METKNKIELKEVIISKISDLLKIDKSEVDSDQEFMEMGIASVEAMSLFVAIQKETGVVISPMIMFECNTVNQICDYLNKKELAK